VYIEIFLLPHTSACCEVYLSNVKNFALLILFNYALFRFTLLCVHFALFTLFYFVLICLPVLYFVLFCFTLLHFTVFYFAFAVFSSDLIYCTLLCCTLPSLILPYPTSPNLSSLLTRPHAPKGGSDMGHAAIRTSELVVLRRLVSKVTVIVM
jgi:hypothetical protein